MVSLSFIFCKLFKSRNEPLGGWIDQSYLLLIFTFITIDDQFLRNKRLTSASSFFARIWHKLSFKFTLGFT